MSNYILLCHGGLKDHSSFELKSNQTVQYRGNYGTNLSSSTAKALVQALRSDACVTDKQIASQFKNYTGQEPLEGPNTFAPDIVLQGDNNLLCFLMRMDGRRPWTRLGSGFSSTLGQVVRSLGAPLWLNLLCCTELPGLNEAPAFVEQGLEVKNWSDIITA